MYGGDAIAAGSQGCIFLPKLTIANEANGRAHARNSANTTKITKIFYDKSTYLNELRILRRVREITGGIGVIDYDATLLNAQIDVLNSPIPARFQSACEVIRQALAANKPVYAMNQTKVLGSIDKLPNNTKPLAFFKLGFEALLKLVTHNIIHLDPAARNVFYTEDNAIIGDFGYGFDMSIDSTFDTNLDRYYTHHMIMSAGVTPVQRMLDAFSLARDSISYEASFAMYFYKNWEEKDAMIHAFFDDRELRDTVDDLYKPFFDDVEPGYFEKITAYVADIRDTIHTKEEMKTLLKNTLRHSDLQTYIRSIIPKLNILRADKSRLNSKCIVNNNYDFFYELLGQKPSKNIAAQLALLESGALDMLTEEAISAAESATRNREARFPYGKANKWAPAAAAAPVAAPAAAPAAAAPPQPGPLFMRQRNGNVNRQFAELNNIPFGSINGSSNFVVGGKKRASSRKQRKHRKQRRTRKH